MGGQSPQYVRASQGQSYGGYDTPKGWSGEYYREILAH